MSNAHGSELLDLPIPIQTQYWNGSVFITNAQDNCTSLVAGNVTLGNYKPGTAGSITAANMASPGHVSLGGAFALGIGSLKLIKPSPTPTLKGSVDVTVDLSVGSKTYLQSGVTFSSDPVVRATFGVYKAGPVIYMRENY
jgi:MSHA biogenesis protein MshQ